MPPPHRFFLFRLFISLLLLIAPAFLTLQGFVLAHYYKRTRACGAPEVLGRVSRLRSCACVFSQCLDCCTYAPKQPHAHSTTAAASRLTCCKVTLRPSAHPAAINQHCSAFCWGGCILTSKAVVDVPETVVLNFYHYRFCPFLLVVRLRLISWGCWRAAVSFTAGHLGTAVNTKQRSAGFTFNTHCGKWLGRVIS